MLSLSYNGRQIQNNSVVSYDYIKNPPTVWWNNNPKILYTILLYKSNSNDIFFAATNIPGINISASTILVPYKPLTLGRYTLAIYKQIEWLYDKLNNIQSYVTNNNLSMLSSINFEVSDKLVTHRSQNVHYIQPVLTKKVWYNESIGEKDRSYCRCVDHVAARQRHSCLRQKAWYQMIEGKKCYNPYAVCSSRIGTTFGRCTENAHFKNMPDDVLQAHAALRNLSIPSPYNRNTLLNTLHTYASKNK